MKRIAGAALAACVVVFIATVLVSPAHAFCPKNGFVCAVTAKSSGSKTHQDITQTSIEALDKSYFGVSKLTSAMQKALDQIIEANADVDDDQTTSAKHFDGENATGAQARLDALKSDIQDALRADPINAIGARKSLGSALHTIQDFYSHSNWVEQGNSGANPGVGRPVSLGFAGPGEPTCVGFNDTGFTCANSSIFVTTALTSGYYGGEDRVKPSSNKCSHGGPLDKSSPSSDPLGYFREGINKDTRYCDISPHSTFHDSAAAAAVEGTRQFVSDIKAVVTPAQLGALLGAGPTLAFSIDTTGSMGSIIAGVRSAAIGIVNARLGTDEEPLQYVLSPFNDPATGPVSVTNDATAFKASISALFASGGGDCPELSMTGVYNGLAASNDGGSLFLFTDASSKDASLAGTVTALAAKKDIKVYPALFGSCSPIDPAYLSLATITGGQVFYLNSGEASTITQLADLTARNNSVQLFSVLDSYATAKSYTVPIDAGLKRVVIAASSTDQVSLPKVTVTRTDGTVVSSGNLGVTVLALSRGVVIAVDNPAAGNWTVKVENSTQPTYLNVTGVSDLKFNSFKFANFGFEPPHQGLKTIAGTPIVGQPLYALAMLTDGFSTASFTLRRKNYSPLAPLPLEKDTADPRVFFGPLTIPSEPFLAYVNGTDSSGQAYQRVLPVTIGPQTVSLIAPSAQDLRPGKLTTLVYQVQNFGAPGSFRFAVTDDKRFVQTISPTSFTLNTGDTVNVTVSLQPGASVAIGTPDTVTATVTSVSDPTLTNTAALTLYVTGSAIVASRPDFVASIIGQEKLPSGAYALDVRFTNTGPGTARQFTLNSLNFRTLGGSGAVKYNTTLGPSLPLIIPNVDVGAFVTVRLTTDVPSTVTRFSVTESGSVQDSIGATFGFSQAQSVIPAK